MERRAIATEFRRLEAICYAGKSDEEPAAAAYAGAVRGRRPLPRGRKALAVEKRSGVADAIGMGGREERAAARNRGAGTADELGRGKRHRHRPRHKSSGWD